MSAKTGGGLHARGPLGPTAQEGGHKPQGRDHRVTTSQHTSTWLATQPVHAGAHSSAGKIGSHVAKEAPGVWGNHPLHPRIYTKRGIQLESHRNSQGLIAQGIFT